MRMAFVGAQRVGKTTLARAYAEKYDLPFVQTQTRSVFERLGLSAKEQYPIGIRLMLQHDILDCLSNQWQENSHAVFDRTPFDCLAYMECDVLRDFPQQHEREFAHYRESCLDAAAVFDAIVLVQPGIPIIEEDGAAPGSPAYMEHFNDLCRAYTIGRANCFELPRRVLDLGARLSFVRGVHVCLTPEPLNLKEFL